jgi:hypothetical protein
MIRKFNQFINENANRQNLNRAFQAIDVPVSEFIDRVQERTKIFTERINELANNLDKAVEMVMSYFESSIVGEPIITASKDIYHIDVKINTNIPNTVEAWEADASAAQDLEHDLSKVTHRYEGVHSSILPDPNEDGNCVINIYSYIVVEDNFGESTAAISKFGEDY